MFIFDYIQLLDEVEQNIVICQWRADQSFADAKELLLSSQWSRERTFEGLFGIPSRNDAHYE